MDLHWHHTFFQGIALELWDRAVDPQQTRREADFILSHLNVQTGAHLLDVPCGSGRMAIEMARREYRSTGVDLAEENIRIAKRRSGELSLDVAWICSDMRELRGIGPLDGALCMGNSFCYFGAEGMQQMATALASALRPGSRCVVQTNMAAESLPAHGSQRLWMEVGDITFLVENTFVPAESRFVGTCHFIRDGRRETGQFVHWVYTVRELCTFLEHAGLRVIHLLASLDGAAYQYGCPALYLVAEKR